MTEIGKSLDRKLLWSFFFGYATEREYKGKPKREIFSALNICLGRDCTFAKETVSASRGARSCYYKNKRERKIESLKESLPIWVLLCLPSIMRFCCGPAGMQELQGGRGFAGKQSWAQYGPNGCRTHSAASCWYMSHWSWPMAPCTGQPSFLFFFFSFSLLFGRQLVLVCVVQICCLSVLEQLPLWSLI